MLHLPLCRESVLVMPRIEIEFVFDMVFCFGICLAVFFPVGFTFKTIARPVESDRPINIVFVRPFLRNQFMNVGP